MGMGVRCTTAHTHPHLNRNAPAHAIILMVMEEQTVVDPKGDKPVQPGTPNALTHVKLVVETSPGACLEVEVEARAPDGSLVGRHTFLLVGGQSAVPVPTVPMTSRWSNWLQAASRVKLPAFLASWQALLVWAALAVYLITRLVALDAFPIYFFTDEAVQTVLAADFLRDGLHNYDMTSR